jgi:hypothetical protein
MGCVFVDLAAQLEALGGSRILLTVRVWTSVQNVDWLLAQDIR